MVKRDECLSKSTLITLAKVNFTLLINAGRRASGREAGIGHSSLMSFGNF